MLAVFKDIFRCLQTGKDLFEERFVSGRDHRSQFTWGSIEGVPGKTYVRCLWKKDKERVWYGDAHL